MLLQKEAAKVLIIEPAATVRMMLTEVLRELCFPVLQPVASLKEGLHYLEVEPVDWVITPLMMHDEVNALHILKLIVQHHVLRQTHVSLFVDAANEDWCLPTAFELGLLSFHQRTYVKEAMQSEFEDLFKILNLWRGNTTLTAAHYIRSFLKEKRFHQSRLGLEQNLLSLYPGSTMVLTQLAEAELSVGSKERGTSLLLQAELIDPKLAQRTVWLKEKYGISDQESKSIDPTMKVENILGLKTVVVIDPDTDVLHSTRETLQAVGVKNIETFEDGKTAYGWLKDNSEPDLILMEWRIPEISGPLLVQKVRQLGFINTSILIMSSLVKKEEKPLLKEMGVDDVLEKPFDKPTFFSSIVWVVQQNRSPTEQRSLEIKIRRLLGQKKMAEAERLIAQVMADSRIEDAFKKEIAAEYEFEKGNFKTAVDLGVESLKLGGESISLLNLVGKAMFKLRQFEGALKCFEKAHSLSPLNVDRLLRIAETNIELNDSVEAKEAIEKAKKIDDGNEEITKAECMLALVYGEVTQASKLMGQLESGSKLTAFMNNRAVLLTRNGRFEEGIELYKKALSAIPVGWGDVKESISYNLALAYARYGEYDQAQKLLQNFKAKEENLQRKAKSLFAKLRRSVNTNKPLDLGGILEQHLNLASEIHEKQEQATDFAELVAKVEAKRGDVCCHLIYRHFEGQEPRTLELLKTVPRFTLRHSIGREESLNSIRKIS